MEKNDNKPIQKIDNMVDKTIQDEEDEYNRKYRKPNDAFYKYSIHERAAAQRRDMEMHPELYADYHSDLYAEAKKLVIDDKPTTTTGGKGRKSKKTHKSKKSRKSRRSRKSRKSRRSRK